MGMTKYQILVCVQNFCLMPWQGYAIEWRKLLIGQALLSPQVIHMIKETQNVKKNFLQ